MLLHLLVLLMCKKVLQKVLNCECVEKCHQHCVFTHLNLNCARIRDNTKGVAGPQCETAGLAEHVVLAP